MTYTYTVTIDVDRAAGSTITAAEVERAVAATLERVAAVALLDRDRFVPDPGWYVVGVDVAPA